jgi:Tol biopolymer transport system component
MGDFLFSPDGKYLAFDSGARRNGGAPAPARDVFVLAIDGHQETAAVVNPADDRLVGWSPDGTQLLFTSDRTGSYGLFAQSVRGGKPQGEPILIRPDVGRLSTLGLTVSGSLYLKRTSPNAGGAKSVVKTGSFDFSTGEMLSPPADLALQYFGASNKSPEWSPDGRFLAYVVEHGSGPGEFSLAVRSLATGGVEVLRPQLGRVEWLRWAPDGKSFVVSAKDLGGVSGLWRVDRATEKVSAIASGTYDVQGIDRRSQGWAPDERKMYYQRALPDKQGVALFERDMTSGLERELLRGTAGPWFATSLSADGKKLYYRQGKATAAEPSVLQAALIERDMASGVERELIRGNFDGPLLSPDGRFIAASTVDLSTKSKSLVLVPVAGGEPRTLMRVDLLQSVIDSPQAKNLEYLSGLIVLWAPDSRSLVFQLTLSKGLWWVPADGREAPKPVNLGVGANHWNVRVHPDGRQFAVAVAVQQPQNQGPVEVWVLENVMPKAGPKR